MTVWKVVVNFLLPPPLILTILLLVPTPRVVQKGLLSFAKHVLFFQVAGGFKLVQMMILLSGLMLLGAAVHTHQLRHAAGYHHELDMKGPKQQVAIRAAIWREERNFWISVLTFLLWGLLYRINALMLEHVNLKDKVRSLEEMLRETSSEPLKGVPPTKFEEPSAPDVPEPKMELRQRQKGTQVE